MSTSTSITGLVLEVIIEQGFAPLDDIGEEFGLSARMASVLDYFAERGWAAVRREDGDTWTLVRWSDEGIALLVIDRNGVSEGEITFPASARGLGWFAAVVA